MSFNILEKITSALGFPPVKPVDPNTQDIKSTSPVARTSQAIVPAVLAGIYRLTKSDEGLEELVRGTHANWSTSIFGEEKNHVINNVAAYASLDPSATEQRLDDAAAVAIRIIHEHIPHGKNEPLAIRKLMADQRNHILAHLPSSLYMGSILEDNTLDDRTNKMQGPISSLLHKIEEGFSKNDTDEEIKKKSNNF